MAVGAGRARRRGSAATWTTRPASCTATEANERPRCLRVARPFTSDFLTSFEVQKMK